MWGRYLPAVLTGLVLATPASADPATVCGGKYANAATILDSAYRRYETLYSGGNHHRMLDGVGATLDVYRLLKDYPDINLRSGFNVYELDGADANRADERRETVWGWSQDPDKLWDRISWAVRPNAPLKPDGEQRFWAGFGWDIMTVGNAEDPDWWRTRSSADADLTPGRKWLVAKARSQPALEWMQLVVTGSSTPWTRNWLPYSSLKTSILASYQSLASSAFARYEAGQGLEWLVASAINAPNVASIPGLAPALDRLAAGVSDCTATPPEYAALASSRLAMERTAPSLPTDPASFDDMPAYIRDIAVLRTTQRAMAAAVESPAEGRKLAAVLGEPKHASHQSLNLLKLYVARTIDAVPVYTSPKLLRAYNALSADHLAALGSRGAGTPVLINAAFARHVALGNTAKATALMDRLKTANPVDAAAIDRIWKGRQPDSVRLALIVLAVPKVSALITAASAQFPDTDFDSGLYLNAEYYEGHRNLPSQYRSLDYLQRDFAIELRAPRKDGYWNVNPWLAREWRRTRNSALETGDAPLLFDPGRKEQIPFAGLIAHDELQRLTGRQHLMATVASRIVSWAEGASRTSADGELIGAALADVIPLCKWNTCGDTRGKPTAQRAFELLKGKFGETKGARRIRWWYKTTEGYD